MKCGKCKQDKPVEDFHQQASSLRRRKVQLWCKPCRKEYDREYHKKRHGSGLKKSQYLANRARNQRFIFEYLSGHPCARCGERDLEVLEFDHNTGKKTTDISLMVIRAWSLEHIAQEIGQCQVLCANCHRKKTAEQFGYWILKYTRV